MQGFCYTVSIVFSLIHLTCLKEGCQYLNRSVINRLTDQTFKDMHFKKITTVHNTKNALSTYKSGKQCSLLKKYGGPRSKTSIGLFNEEGISCHLFL